MARAERLWKRLGSAITAAPNRFWQVLDSNAVIVYQSVVYPAIFAGGWYMLMRGVPKTLDAALYDGVQNLWVLLCICGPPICLAGHLWRHRDDYVSRLGQASGNIAIAFVFYGYVLAVIQENWGAGIFAPFIFVQLGNWSMLLAIRDVRKTIHTEVALRNEDGET